MLRPALAPRRVEPAESEAVGGARVFQNSAACPSMALSPRTLSSQSLSARSVDSTIGLATVVNWKKTRLG
jgi:hypothetical protein